MRNVFADVEELKCCLKEGGMREGNCEDEGGPTDQLLREYHSLSGSFNFEDQVNKL